MLVSIKILFFMVTCVIFYLLNIKCVHVMNSMLSVSKKIFNVAFFLAALFLGSLVFLLHNKSVDFSVLENYSPGRPSILYDDAGKEWGRFQLDRRKFVAIEHMPQHLVQAFLATEDHNFFRHCGLSFKGIARSLLVNLYYGKKVQGASTITQQLVRLLFFDAKKTFTRKVKEQLLSLLVEVQFTKEQILETYLNHVYFGHGIYGVEAAAQRFWGKQVADISVDQAAMLAGMVKAPMHYSPISFPLSAQKRRNIVIASMQQQGFLTTEQARQYKDRDLEIREYEKDVIAPHLKESIRVFLEDLVGREQLYSGGLYIQTTLNIDIQKAAEHSFVDHVTKLREKLPISVDGGLVTIEGSTGEVKALIGGYSFQSSKFNRALQAKRQMGSIFKPMVYAAAIEKGASFIDTDIDEPLEIVRGGQVWTPQNNTKKFTGISTLARALSYSNNIITIKTLLRASVDHVIDVAKRCHILGKMNPYPSLALGCVDGTIMEAVGAFNVFAQNGMYSEPHYLRWVKNRFGEKIYKSSVVSERAMSAAVAGQVNKVLTLGMVRLQRVIGQRWFGGDAMGKTGTTNDSRTCWFCGATPDLTTAIYIGGDGNQSMGRRVYGSKTSFPIWFGMHKKLPSKKKKKFYYDSSLQEVNVNWKTGEVVEDQKGSEVCTLLI